MSGYTSGALSAERLRAIGARLLQKPFNPELLVRTVEDEMAVPSS